MRPFPPRDPVGGTGDSPGEARREGLPPDGTSRSFLRLAGATAAAIGLVVSLYGFVEIEVFTPGRLVYHLLGRTWTAPEGVAGTAPWPLTGCFAAGPPGYGIPGARCLFPNFDDLVLLFGLLMGAGLILRYSFDPVAPERARPNRLRRAAVRAIRVMSFYTLAVFGWCIVLFGALPTWDESVLWASSSTWSYPAWSWDPITNTCLAPFPGHTSLWPSCYFPNFLECLAVSATAFAVTTALATQWSVGDPPSIGYREWTIDRYHTAIAGVERNRWRYATFLLGFTALAGLLFSPTRSGASPLAVVARPFTLLWLLPVPLLVAGLVATLAWYRADRFRIPAPLSTARVPGARVIFQITSLGSDAHTVRHTLDSLQFWLRRHPDLGFDAEIWLCLDEGQFSAVAWDLPALTRRGIRVVETPVGYRTANGSTRKARALQYAIETRREANLRLDRTFVYHQDDESAVGEDTLLGIDAFVREHGHQPCVGVGVILYPQHAGDLRPSQIQEFGRTNDDLRLIVSATSHRNLLVGYHGSHLLVRADVEDAIGFDAGPDQITEDLLFESRVRARFGPIFYLLRGFAYEQAPLRIPHQLRQRRRWVQGWLHALRTAQLSTARKLSMAYHLIAWSSAFLSLAVVVASLELGFSAYFPFSGVIAGVVWGQILLGTYNGFVLNRPYLGPRTVPTWRILLNGGIGLLVDAAAPWFAFASRRTGAFDVIPKDPPEVAPDNRNLTAPLRDSSRSSTDSYSRLTSYLAEAGGGDGRVPSVAREE